MKRRENATTSRDKQQPTLLALGIALDFGAPLATSRTDARSQSSSGFDNTPKAPPNHFSHRPPDCPSLF